MNDLISNPEPTMSSREIADLVGSRHDAVRKSADRLWAAQILTSPPAAFEYEHNGNTYQEYRFGKRDSLVIVARLSPEYTAAVVDRWQELEAKQAVPDPSKLSRIQILQMAMESEQERIRLEEKVRQDAPKVQFVDRYTDSTGLVSLTQAAKDLQFKPRAFTKALEESGYLYRSGGALTPYQKHLDQGLFAMVNGEKGGHGYSQTKVTTKGKAAFAQRFASELG